MDTELITRNEAAEAAGVTPRTIDRWVQARYLDKEYDHRGRPRLRRAQVMAMNELVTAQAG